METRMTTVNWQTPVALDSTPIIFDLSYTKINIFPVIGDIQSNTSFLHSQKLRQSLLESKKEFFSHSLSDQKPEDEQMEEKSLVLGQSDHKRYQKKISFKIKKQSSLYKRNIGISRVSNIPINKVAELTKKFNEMVEKQNTLEEQRMKIILKPGDSIGSDMEKSNKPNLLATVHKKESLKVSRKPSVKTKPNFENKNLVIIKTKPPRKSSFKKQFSDKISACAKSDCIKRPHIKPKSEEYIARPTTLNLNLNIPKKIIETSPNGTSVRAAIEIFERKSIVPSPTKSENSDTGKPKIPFKSLTVQNLRKSSTLPNPQKGFTESKKLYSSLEKSKNQSNKLLAITDIKSKAKYDTDKNNETVEFKEDEVQIINIPAVLPQRRCDSMYETINLRKVSPHSIKSKSAENICSDTTNKKSLSMQPNTSFLWRDKSPSSNYSSGWINTTFLEQVTSSSTGENREKTPPNPIPPKHASDFIAPVISSHTLKKKMPLPDLTRNSEQEDTYSKIAEYEEIGYHLLLYQNNTKNNLSEVIALNDEKFKSFDEITKPVNEVEVIEMKETHPEKYYEEIKRDEEKIYEELVEINNDDGYEPVGNKLGDTDEKCENCSSLETENIYETLPIPSTPLRRQQQEPLPPRPPSSVKNDETASNCYETINNAEKKYAYYESIYGTQLTDSGSNRDSVLSSDHKSNSLYGKTLPVWDYNSGTYYKPSSDISSERGSERSDEWEDLTDNDEEENRIIIVRERTKGKKSGWSKHMREQWSKSSKLSAVNGDDYDPDHHYETLYSTKHEDFDYDSFESDTESEHSFDKIHVDDSGIDIGSSQLPERPNSQSYGLIKFAGKHMKRFRSNFSIDITKSLTRMTKRISKTDIEFSGTDKEERKLSIESKTRPCFQNSETAECKNSFPKLQVPYQDIDLNKNSSTDTQTEETDKLRTLSRKGFLSKFRRSMSMSSESASELTSNLNGNKTKSTFYLTDTIDVDGIQKPNELIANEIPVSPIMRNAKYSVIRPNSPPPPAPIAQSDLRKFNCKDGKSASWYAEAGLFRNNDSTTPKRPNTFWYAEIGLYQSQSNSSPSTSSAENSGSNISIPIKAFEIPRPLLKTSDFINQDETEKFHNMKNEDIYYSESINSFSSIEAKKDESLKQDIQLRLQDEPLYQFYDAAVLESVSYDSTSDFDSDNYEDVIENDLGLQLNIRPTVMELVSPKRNSFCFTKTLWCEIPEVITSSVLSTLSVHQKKIQEAKFEILTSEASYLNSLNVLFEHFVKNCNTNNIITKEEKEIMFGHVEAVKNSSEKLLHDLEKCWQDNILLHGICDIVQKHAEENFNVYIPYCENQIVLDDTLKQLRVRAGFTDFLRQLEASAVCQSLTLYSFLMLPMQRITRWPLLIDAVLKRLSQQDAEFYACQMALATVNKTVNQCNEAARKKERETELKKITNQLEFPPNMSHIPIFTSERWLVRCGAVTHIQTRNEDNKLTFGKKFGKNSIYLFLFNDLFLVTKEKSDSNYSLLHYCPRNLVELSTSDVIFSLPIKEAHGKNFIFLTILENQDGKTIEYLLSCNSDSDKERWIEALTPPKSEDPEETLYECWDCPQVSVIHSYIASQPDELALSKGDVVNVLRKMADGWHHGERIRDGRTGWFPANHTVEIANFHVRARNLKQRYRLLAFSEKYLKTK